MRFHTWPKKERQEVSTGDVTSIASSQVPSTETIGEKLICRLHHQTGMPAVSTKGACCQPKTRKCCCCDAHCIPLSNKQVKRRSQLRKKLPQWLLQKKTNSNPKQKAPLHKPWIEGKQNKTVKVVNLIQRKRSTRRFQELKRLSRN